jgi:hypothetical protein
MTNPKYFINNQIFKTKIIGNQEINQRGLNRLKFLITIKKIIKYTLKLQYKKIKIRILTKQNINNNFIIIKIAKKIF